MSGNCVVPECQNIKGVLLSKVPKCDSNLSEALGLEDGDLSTETFVCFEHLKSKHLDQDVSSTSLEVPSFEEHNYVKNDMPVAVDSAHLSKNETGQYSENLCRVCLSDNSLNIDIFDYIEEDVTIASAIMLCVHPLKILEDYIPRGICDFCYERLKIAYKFYKKCIMTDNILQNRYKKLKRKRLKINSNLAQIKKIKDESSLDTQEVREIKQDTTGTSTFNSETFFPPVLNAEQCIDEIEKNMEIIHGEHKEADDLLSGGNKKSIINECKSTKHPEKPDILSNLRLSQELKITCVPFHARASTGKFKSTVKLGINDTPYVQVNGFLFEYGLLKGVNRHLRCTVPSCFASAKQALLPNGKNSEMVEVLQPHNHQPPTASTIKKHMLLCWMRKKMQSDKTINIRNMYEDACFQDPEIKRILPLRNVVNEICRHQIAQKIGNINSFEMFHKLIDTDAFEKLHFTHNNQQFYHEKFYVEEDDSMAVLFANPSIIKQLSDSEIMYVDASFKIDTKEDFKYQLVTVLVWVEDSYFPILFTLVNKKSRLLFHKIFTYLRYDLAPELRPQEVITDYEANIYYALAEIYTESIIGGSVFYYTQNLYKKLCSLNLSQDLETNAYFRNIYHMLLMLPLLPVNTVLDGLNSIEMEARTLNISQLARPLFDHVRTQWILNVTPELFCVHKLENRINENVIAPFKKLRDFLMLTKGKGQKIQITVTYVVEKIIELEQFLRGAYTRTDKKSFGRDLSSSQKKSVLRAWQYIEDHPKIEMSNFFSKVLGYIKCMENQLWIWGFYGYDGDTDDILINATRFSIQVLQNSNQDESELSYIQIPDTIVVEAVVDQDGMLQPHSSVEEIGVL